MNNSSLREEPTHLETSQALGLSYYEYSKDRPSRTLKNFKNLIDALNKTTKEEANYALIAYVYKDDTYVVVSYFKDEKDAAYSTRYLKGIAKREYHGFRLSFEKISTLEIE